MEEEKTCRTCTRLQDNGFCSLQTAREIEECINNRLSHWSSVYNKQYAIDFNTIDNM